MAGTAYGECRSWRIESCTVLNRVGQRLYAGAHRLMCFRQFAVGTTTTNTAVVSTLSAAEFPSARNGCEPCAQEATRYRRGVRNCASAWRLNALGIKGVGEIGIVGVSAAIANAVFHATGRRFRSLPIKLEQLL